MNEEKKLTDEEIVKALECCINDKCSEECPYRGKRYDCIYQHRHEKDLLYLINRQKAEIERLKDENCHDYHCMRLAQQESAELQKQVDELKAFKDEAISMSLYGKGRKDGEEIAVKYTAKEIYQELCKHGATYVKKWIKNRYGVEVE